MNNSNRYNPIPDPGATALLHSIGLLLQQAGMYGMGHNVAQLALQEAFARLETTLALHGAIEFAVSGSDLLVNGSTLASKDPSIASMASRIEQHKLGGILFLPAIDHAEFSIFIRLMTSSPAAIANLGGLRQAIEDAGLRYVKLVNTEYRKVPEGEPAPPPAPTDSKASDNKVFSLGAGASGGVLDLSSELGGAPQSFAPPSSADEAGAEDAAKRRRRENAKKMADLLRATAALLENSGALPPEIEQRQILSAIERILHHLESSSVEVRKQINRLAGQVEADRQTIASIESAARRRGIGFNLTRKELLEQYAEINQEILQPVTVSAGALDLLLSGRCGDLSSSQKELIHLAFEGMERVNQLIAYTNRISGLPESLQPDAGVVRDTYRGQDSAPGA